MPAELAKIETWLIGEWISRLTAAVESMAAVRPAVTSSALEVPPEAAPSAQIWRQPLPPLAGAVWVVAPTGSAEALGGHVLHALGVEDAGEEEQRSTFRETLNQALAGLAQALTARLQREVNLAGGGEARPPEFPQAAWSTVNLTLGDQPAGDKPAGDQPVGDHPVELLVGLEAALTESIQLVEVQPAPVPEPLAPHVSAPRSPADNSKTFALLLEVELPVAVSFGRAQIPLKDVLKLTTGSIVELNRAVTEPVEIIVNNCVIARGEVVVVEGNFGVRIQEVVNRQERLRTVQ
ncbi:MAG TPA: flagellar motor switch protein FliN [Bryobacteraceae bacterium]|nr:flagellar motor switch protein FliN [Bryobacteraceae bacterium]